MNVIAYAYIAGGILMLIAVAVPSVSSALTRIGGAIFGIGAVLVGVARLQGQDRTLMYAGSLALVIGAVIYLLGTFRDRRSRKP
jgi:predicted anti-sigma-YlaC factor YlaD